MPKSKKILWILAVTLLSAVPVSRVRAQEPSGDRQTEYIITLPKGTVFPIILTAYLNTKNSQAGDIVYATTTYPVWFQQKLVIPKGSEIRGTLTDVVRPGRVKGKGRIVIRFDDILLPNGVRRDLSATFRGIHGPGDETLNREEETVEGGGSEGEDVESVIEYSAKGVTLGTLIGGLGSGRPGMGAAIGVGAGAAAGVIGILASRGKDLILEPGTQFDLELMAPMEFSYYELDFTRSELNEARQSVAPPPAVRPSGSRDSSRGRSGSLPGIGFPF